MNMVNDVIWCKFVIIILCFGFIATESSIYPSIYWNPWNPIFACEEPKINVRIGDTINFLCPSDDFNFYVPSSHVNMIFENLYFLGNNNISYKECNATGMRKLLNCDAKPTTTNLYTISFRDIRTSPDSLTFKKGNTYYLIGTGFRKSENLVNTVDGSCRKVDGEGQFRMRLQIHVCSDDEINTGKCEICKSEGCYYHNCSRSCTKWKYFNFTSNGKCYTSMNRSCTYPFLSYEPKVEFKYDPVGCPTSMPPPTAAHRKGNNEDFPMGKCAIISIVCTAIAFILGLFLGCCFKNRLERYSKKCPCFSENKKDKDKRERPLTTTTELGDDTY